MQPNTKHQLSEQSGNVKEQKVDQALKELSNDYIPAVAKK